jgi:hypothetical protein
VDKAAEVEAQACATEASSSSYAARESRPAAARSSLFQMATWRSLFMCVVSIVLVTDSKGSYTRSTLSRSTVGMNLDDRCPPTPVV